MFLCWCAENRTNSFDGPLYRFTAIYAMIISAAKLCHRFSDCYLFVELLFVFLISYSHSLWHSILWLAFLWRSINIVHSTLVLHLALACVHMRAFGTPKHQPLWECSLFSRLHLHLVVSCAHESGYWTIEERRLWLWLWLVHSQTQRIIQLTNYVIVCAERIKWTQVTRI